MPNTDDQVVDGFGENPFSDENLDKLKLYYSYRSDSDAHIICLAVDEIKRLRAEVNQVRHEAVSYRNLAANVQEKNKKLEAEVERLEIKARHHKRHNEHTAGGLLSCAKKLAAYEEAMREVIKKSDAATATYGPGYPAENAYIVAFEQYERLGELVDATNNLRVLLEEK